jgi:L-threonylcarbamoyladenylate synthase
MLAVHYAPHTMALLCPSETLISMVDELCAKGKNIGILAFSDVLYCIPGQHLAQLPKQSEHYESVLYSTLREMDKLQLDMILIEQPPDQEAWAAVNDRLSRATV